MFKILGLFFLANSIAWADTSLVFDSTNGSAIIKIGEADAVNFYNAINAPVNESSQMLKKSFTYLNQYNDKEIDFSCEISKIAEIKDSCSIIIFESAHSTISNKQTTAVYNLLNRSQAEVMMRNFKLPRTDAGYSLSTKDNLFGVDLWQPYGFFSLGFGDFQ